MTTTPPTPSPNVSIPSAMETTLRRQPDDLHRLLREGWDQAGAAAAMLAPARRVFLVGIGTSYHAALVGSWLFRAAGFDARALLSSDLARYPGQWGIGPGDAVIVMAHTGVKTDSGAALRLAAEAGAAVLSAGSLTAEHPGSGLVMRTVPRETSAAYTASHLAAMVVLAQVATVAGEARDTAGTAPFRDALGELPDQVAGVIDRAGEIEPVAALANGRRVYATGAGPNEATALELTIKAREAAYGWVDAMALEQFLHGPAVAVNRDDLAIVVHVPGAAAGRTSAVAGVLAAMGARLWIVGEATPDAPGAETFGLPGLAGMPEVLTPLLAVVPMQILALRMATQRGTNPDTFRRDDPAYAAAFGRVTL